MKTKAAESKPKGKGKPKSTGGRRDGSCSAFAPEFPLDTPGVLVSQVDDPCGEEHPFSYFLNAWLRHREKLSGLAGNVWNINMPNVSDQATASGKRR